MSVLAFVMFWNKKELNYLGKKCSILIDWNIIIIIDVTKIAHV
jgi:hypothetical protein